MKTLIAKLILFFLISTQGALFAQTGGIKGIIKDSTGVIELANIMVAGTKLFTTSDANGFYNIDRIPAGTYALTVSVVGYSTASKKISIHEGQILEVNFKLEKKINLFKEVAI